MSLPSSSNGSGGNTVGRAAEAGPAAAWLCSDQAAFVTGTLTVDGAMTAGMPRSAARPPEAAARPSDL